MINSFADRGMGILVTTHYLEEAEQCNRLGLMVAGELVAQGSPSDLKAGQKGQVIEFVTDAPQRANKQISERLGREQISVSRAETVPYSLEDVFIAIVEKMRREGKKTED